MLVSKLSMLGSLMDKAQAASCHPAIAAVVAPHHTPQICDVHILRWVSGLTLSAVDVEAEELAWKEDHGEGEW